MGKKKKNVRASENISQPNLKSGSLPYQKETKGTSKVKERFTDYEFSPNKKSGPKRRG